MFGIPSVSHVTIHNKLHILKKKKKTLKDGYYHFNDGDMEI